MSQSITIYTDGSSIGNPGPGGYGVVMMFGQHRKEISEGFRLTTNNRMELLAVIVALESLKRTDLQVNIFTDSQYVCNAINKGWLHGWIKKGFSGVKNVDLWQRFLPIFRQYKVTMHWVKGHSGVPENERCDVLATTAARLPNLPADVAYEESVK